MATSMPSMPAAVRREAADQGAGDLADREEHGIEAHDRAAVVREALGDVGEQPEGGRRRAGQHEQPERRDRPRPRAARAIGRPSPWFTTRPAATRAPPPRMPYRMIVVRRMVLNRLPQYSRPTPKMMAMAIAASVIWIALNPRIRAWSGKAGFSLANWKIDWLNHSPIDALTAIHVGASSQTWELRSSSR